LSEVFASRPASSKSKNLGQPAGFALSKTLSEKVRQLPLNGY